MSIQVKNAGTLDAGLYRSQSQSNLGSGTGTRASYLPTVSHFNEGKKKDVKYLRIDGCIRKVCSFPEVCE